MTETHLDRHLAAISVASEHGISPAKYANSEELAILRGTMPAQPQASGVPALTRGRPATRSDRPLVLDITFVSDATLRAILERDISELNTIRSCGVDKTRKTCMILCGSIAEALLLERLLQDEPAALAAAIAAFPKISHNPEDWDLAEMVTIATRVSPPVLSDDAGTGASQLRKWRNLVHPGRELKEKRNKRVTPSPARAANAIAFLQLIVEELGK